MFWLVAALLLVVGPIVELWFILQVASVIGGWETLALLLVEGVVGGWLIKRQGRSVVSRVDARLRARDLPTKELADGFLILTAGVLMLTPGFLTDIVGFALIFPPTRAIARVALLRRFTAKLGEGLAFTSFSVFRGGPAGGAVFDTTASETRAERLGGAPLGPGEPRS